MRLPGCELWVVCYSRARVVNAGRGLAYGVISNTTPKPDEPPSWVVP